VTIFQTVINNKNSYFFGGCALWRHHPSREPEICLRPSTAVPQEKPSLFPGLVLTL
jgi:hypothetical protein